jgi:hypothetical protein
MKGAHRSGEGIGIALSQSTDFIRDWHGNSEDGEDEGEEYQSEFIHRQKKV